MIFGFIKKELMVFIAGMLFSVISQVWGMGYGIEANIEKHAETFSTPHWSLQNKKEIVDALKVIPSSDLESVVTQVHSLRTYMGKSSKVGLIIRTFSQMPSHERSIFCREISQIFQILGPEQSQEQYSAIFSHFKGIPPEAREGLSDCLRRLNCVFRQGELLQAIKEIEKIPHHERKDFSDLVGSFRFDNDLIEGIKCLKSIPLQERMPFKDFALPLIKKLNDIKDKSFIAEWLFYNIPLDDRETIFSTWDGLSPIFFEFNKLRDSSDVIALINFVKELSKEERVTTEWYSFSSYVLPFLSLANSSQEKKIF